MKVTPWPMKTWSSIVTPSQIKVWLETLHRWPTLAFFWISTNAPIFVSAPISHPYRLMNFESSTSFPSLTSGAMHRYSFTGRPPLACGTATQASTGTLPYDDGHRRRQKDLDVGPEGTCPAVPEVEAHHLVEAGTAAAGHLPEPGDPRLGLQEPAPMPGFVLLELVQEGRAGPDQRHVASEHVP